MFRAADGSVDLSDLTGATGEEIDAVEKTAWKLKEFFAATEGEGGPLLQPWVEHQGGILDRGGEAPELDKVFFWANRDEDFRSGVGAELSRAREGDYPAPAAPEVPGEPTGKQRTPAADADFGADPAEDADFGDSSGEDADFGASPTEDADSGDSPAKDAAFGSTPAADADFGDSPGEDADFGGGNSSEEPPPSGEGAEERADLSTTPHKLARAKQWQHSGGWWQHGGAVHYRAQGHADPVIVAWIEAAVAACNAEDPAVRASGEKILLSTFQWAKGVDSMASGRCLKCHTVDRDAESGRFRVNWHPAHGVAGLSNRPAGLTRYSHEKHIIAMDCLNCHLPKDKSGYSGAFPVEVALPAAAAPADSQAAAKLDPSLTFHPNFQPMVKEQCATCHRKNVAGNDCLQCHLYHAPGHAENADAASRR